MDIGINLLPRAVVGIEGMGVRLSDGVTSDIWYHPNLASLIVAYAGGVRADFLNGKLAIHNLDGQFVSFIATEELESSVQRMFQKRRGWKANNDPAVLRAMNH